MSRYVRSLALLLALVFVGPSSRAADATAGQTLDANGVKIRFYVQGKGEPVVLIHGLFSSADINWKANGVINLLAKNFQVIALDIRGHGRSDKPTKEDAYGPELVEDVVRLLDHLKIKKAHIIGYSMGGIIAGSFLVKHPDRTLSGTLAGMGWLRTGGFGQWGFSQMGRNDRQPKAVAVCGRSLAKLALTEKEIKSIRVPVAVLVGDKDNLIKKLYVEPVQRVRKDWPVVAIKDGDHLSCIFKKQFGEEIASWLKMNSK